MGMFAWLAAIGIGIFARTKGRDGFLWGVIFLALRAGGYLVIGMMGGNQLLLDIFILIAMILLIVSLRKPENDVSLATPEPDTKKCQYCAEDIKFEAKVCKHCRREV